MFKQFIDFLHESEAPMNVSDPSVIATTPSHLIARKKFGGVDELVVHDDAYSQIRDGRAKHSKWDKYVTCPVLRQAMQDAINTSGRVMVTSEKTGAAAFIKKWRE